MEDEKIEETSNPVVSSAPSPARRNRGGRRKKAAPNVATENVTFEMPMAEADDKQGILKSALGKLGLNSSGNDAPQSRLNRKQQDLYDGIAPVAVNAFIVAATWGWTLAGPQCSTLAPSDEVAAKIVHPLVRIYARMQKDGTPINPNYIDFAASMTALIGYVYTSTSLFVAYKRGELQVEEPSTHEQHYTRETRASGYDSREDYYSREQQGGEDSPASYRDVGNPSTEPRKSLSIQQRQQRDALAKLSRLDFETRARRSGNTG